MLYLHHWTGLDWIRWLTFLIKKKSNCSLDLSSLNYPSKFTNDVYNYTCILLLWVLMQKCQSYQLLWSRACHCFCPFPCHLSPIPLSCVVPGVTWVCLLRRRARVPVSPLTWSLLALLTLANKPIPWGCMVLCLDCPPPPITSYTSTSSTTSLFTCIIEWVSCVCVCTAADMWLHH